MLAPSANALRSLILLTTQCALELELSFNYDKTKIMIFHSSRTKLNASNCFKTNGYVIELVDSIKYLGYIITDNLDYKEDLHRVKSKFYAEFNTLLRNFHFADSDIKVYLFKHYCIQLYGSELWFGGKCRKQELKQFAVGYHKAIKKLIGVLTHESNHFAC